jgi:mannose-1-phosphate guanylyltransferase
MKALILAGGSGLRFWPLSTKSTPKHLLKLFQDKSMIRLTFERIITFMNPDDIYIITIREQVVDILREIPEIRAEQVIVEPLAMNTAACICFASHNLSKVSEPDEVVYTFPADHYIQDIEVFKKQMLEAIEFAIKDYMIIFGIRPMYPATGYGYIEKGDNLNDTMFRVKQFKEKPNIKTAVEFLKSKQYLWNSGIFCWKLSTILSAFKVLQSEIFNITAEAVNEEDNEKALKKYAYSPKIPVDIAILENATNVCCLPVSFFWSDVGNWKSLSDILPKDENENIYTPNTKIQDVANTSIFTKKPTIVIGVSDLIIVEHDDKILVVNKDVVEKVKEMVDN